MVYRYGIYSGSILTFVRFENIKYLYYLFVISFLMVQVAPLASGPFDSALPDASDKKSEETLILTLSLAEEMVLKQNPDLKIKSNDLENAKLSSENAFSLFYPDVSLFAGYGYFDPVPGVKKELIPGVPIRLSMGQPNAYSYGIQMRYLLFAGGRGWDAYRAARLGEEAEMLQFSSEKRGAVYRIRKAFFYTLLSREVNRLAGEASSRASDRLEKGEARYKQGAIASLELLRLKTEAADMELIKQESENKYRAALDSIRIILDLSETGKLQISGTLLSAGKILENRESTSVNVSKKTEELEAVQIARIREKQAQILAEIEKDDFYPTVSAAIKYDNSNPYLGQPIFGNNFNFQLGATFPIFEGGRSYNEYKIAKKKAENASMMAGKMSREIAAYRLMLMDRRETLQRSIAVRSGAMQTAQKALSATEVGWRNGSSTYTDLRESELIRIRMEIEYYRAIVETLECYAEEERIAGEEIPGFKRSMEAIASNGESQEF